MRIALSAFVLLLLTCSIAGGFYALHVTEPEQAATTEVITEEQPEGVAEPLQRSGETRNVWQEPRRKLPEFNGSQPRPVDMTPETASVEAAPYAEPAADTQTMVTVSTCGGQQFEINAAEKAMLDLHTRERASRGLSQLCVSPVLTYAARQHSQDMVARDYFSHVTPENISVTERVGDAGYPTQTRYGAGENLAMGTDAGGLGTPESMFEGLMNSPGHKANIVNPDYQEIGVGVVRGYFDEYEDSPLTMYTVNFGLWYDR